MATTIAESISRIRNITKTVKEDAFVTDRFLYSLVIKHAKNLIKKQDSINQLIKFASLFRTLPCMPLVEVDKVEACCGGITSECMIMRTEKPIPGIMEATFGPLFRTVGSIDYSTECFQTTPAIYTAMTKTSSYKFNNRKYYWFINNYLYFPNISWEAIRIEGIFEDSLAGFNCTDPCITRQEQEILIPGYLFAEIEQAVKTDLITEIQIPPHLIEDKQSTTR